MYFEKVADISNNAKLSANWIMGDFASKLNEAEITISESKIKAKDLADLIKLIDNNTISSKIAKTVFEEMFETGKDPKSIVEEKGLVQITDENALQEIVNRIVENNPKSVEDYKAGRDRAIGFLVGQIMKETKGKANPGIVNKMLIDILNK